VPGSATRLSCKKVQMENTIKTGSILTQEGTRWPESVQVESSVFSPGWRNFQNQSGYSLSRKIEEAKWCFFYLAGEMHATAVGRAGQETVAKAVKRILVRVANEKYNALEVTEICTKRFLGVPYVRVCAHSRHIQESTFLVTAKGHTRNAAHRASSRDVAVAFGNGGRPRPGTEAAKQTVTMISNS
jgi:hypothetical protein